MSELLPCPFCGGEAHMSASSDGYGVQCWNRRCIDMQMEEIPTEAEAIAAWNSRAERTCEFVNSRGDDRPPSCSVCGYETDIYECAWYEDGTYGYERNYCPNCGARVVV